MDRVAMPTEGRAGADDGRTIEAVIQREILELLFKSLPRGLILTAINAALTAYLLRDHASAAMIGVWLTIMFSVTALRGVAAAYYFQNRQRQTCEEWSRQFVIGAVAAGATWGSAAILLMPLNSMGHQMFLGFVLAGMAAGAMASLSFDTKAYPIYVAISIGPFAIAMLVVGGEIQLVMGVMAVLFIAAMIQGGRAFQQAIVETLRLRFENEKLAGELRQKAEREAKANRALQLEIERTAAAEVQMRRARDEADSANRAKSQFLANMSHEIRTPMNGVLGMTDLLLKSNLDDRQRHLAGTLQSSGSMLLSIIDDILDLSRIEAGMLSLKQERFEPRVCVADAVEMLGTQARQKGLTLTLHTTGNLPAAVEGDPIRLRQVCANLVGNAIKFTAAGRVDVRLASETCDDGRVRLLIEVEDTGIGIENSALGRILKPFEQADASTSRRYGGTGLGLAICSNLVTKMGGKLGIESEPGRGTLIRFDAVLPLAQGEAPSCLRKAEALRFDGKRVLVAEDNPVNQEIARTYLEELGCTVDVVDNGKAAVEACGKYRYALVLMDCQMPELDGLEASIQIRALEITSGLMRTPILALTASAFEEDRVRCFAAGMDDHLSKPYSADQLAETLGIWIETVASTHSMVRGERRKQNAERRKRQIA